MATVAFRTKEKKPTYSREFEESKSRYVIYIGETENGKLATHANDMQIGVPYLERCVPTEIINHSYYDRDSDDRINSTYPRHPDPKRREEVKVTIRAAQIADHLERRFGNDGLINFEAAVGQDPELIAITFALLLPIDDDEKLRTISLKELRSLVESQLANPNIKFPNKAFAKEIADTLVKGINRTLNHILHHLATMKGEMEQRRTANGIGISKLDERARRLLVIADESAASYEVDGQSLQQALVSQFIGANKPQATLDATVIASTIGAVLQQLGIVPQVPQVATDPKAQFTATASDGKDAFEGVAADSVQVSVSKPKQSNQPKATANK